MGEVEDQVERILEVRRLELVGGKYLSWVGVLKKQEKNRKGIRRC